MLASGRLRDKVFIITGTGGGMGRAAALRFAKEGAKVVGCDIHSAAAQATLADVLRCGGDMISMDSCDMTDEAHVGRLFDLALETYKGIDVLYNNASKAYADWLPEMSYETWGSIVNMA